MQKTKYDLQTINSISAFEPQTIGSQGMLNLHFLVKYAKLLGVSELEFSDDIEEIILSQLRVFRITYLRCFVRFGLSEIW